MYNTHVSAGCEAPLITGKFSGVSFYGGNMGKKKIAEKPAKKLFVDQTHKEAFLRGMYARLGQIKIEERPYHSTSLYVEWLFGLKNGRSLLPHATDEKEAELDKKIDEEIQKVVGIIVEERQNILTVLMKKLAKDAGIV